MTNGGSLNPDVKRDCSSNTEEAKRMKKRAQRPTLVFEDDVGICMDLEKGVDRMKCHENLHKDILNYIENVESFCDMEKNAEQIAKAKDEDEDLYHRICVEQNVMVAVGTWSDGSDRYTQSHHALLLARLAL